MDKVFDALSHPIRRGILEMLRDGGLSAGVLADAFPVSKPTMSGHFARLKDAGLIQAEQRGTSTIYTLNLSAVESVMLAFVGRLQAGKQREPKACRPTPIAE